MTLLTGGHAAAQPPSTPWRPTSPSGLAPTADHSAVWTGSRMIVLSGQTGGIYDPATDTWQAMSTLSGVTLGLSLRTAIWTGTRVIVWGGSRPGSAHNTGAIYDPGTDTWTPTTTVGAPAGREGHTAVWTGTRMIVWGGSTITGTRLRTGGVYDPATDTWAPTNLTGAPTARSLHAGVWTGSRMIVAAGGVPGGGLYDPATDSWTATSAVPAPSARDAVWTGSKMIMWGSFFTPTNAGATYDPATNIWTSTPTSGSPSSRVRSTAVWTGTEMIVWGGGFTNTGGRYDPATNTWKATPSFGVTGRERHTAVWTGTEMVVWGGYDGVTNLNSGAALSLDFIPELSASDNRVVEGTHVGVDVHLSAPLDVGVLVDYTTVDAGAVAGADYIASSGTLQIQAGSTTGRILVQTYGDCSSEGNETFLVRISNPQALGPAPPPTVAIADNEANVVINDAPPPTPVLTMPPPHQTGEGGGTSQIALRIYPPTTCGPVSVQYATRDGSARGGRDYQTTSGTATFPPGVTTQFVSVAVLDDFNYEPDENFFVDLSNPSGIFLSGVTTEIQILRMLDADALFDAEADSQADVVLQHDSGDIGLLASATNSFLAEATWDTGLAPASVDVFFADVDGDGLADLATRDRASGDINVRRSTGSAFVADPGSGPGGTWSMGWTSAFDVLFADVTGDDRADLLARNPVSGDVFVLPSTPGSFGPAALWSYGWTSGYRLFLGDVTGDGKVDLVSQYVGPTAGATGDVYVAVSTGTQFVFSGRWTFGWSAGYEITLADVNDDFRADLVGRYIGTTAGITGNVYVMRSTGSSFSWMGLATRWSYGWGADYDVIVRDFNGDGRADLAGRLRTTGDVHVATSNGSRFVYSGVWATGVGTDATLR